ncbi:transcriptional regulator, LysR family [gut metagenome]|uniref:Transcriptional regulator, LysR family n=1 Tax=gut metagenome TaxID=749906 RepID=J9FU38_9ZZZZ
MRITPAGTLLLKSAREILAIQENLKQNMKTINSIRPLRVGATVTVGTNIIGKIVSQMNELYPDIDIFVNVSNTDHIEHLLLHNELDIALVEGIVTNNELITHPAFLDKLCIICSSEHPFAKKPYLHASDLHSQNFILREKGSGTRSIFEAFMSSKHVPYVLKWESTSTPAILDAVSRNLGLGFVSERCAAKRIAAGELCQCPIPDIDSERFFYLCYSKSHPMTSQMKDFSEYISSLPTDFS